MKSLYVAILFAFLCVPIRAQTTTLVPNEDGIYVKRTLTGPQETRQEMRGSEGFHRGLRKAIRQAANKGEITRVQSRRLRVALFSPSFRKECETVAITQMVFSSNSDVLPFDENGRVEKANINWEGLADFLEKLLPILLQLLEAFGV